MTPPPRRRSRVTGSEVAAAAGVSAATVSYVLNDTPGQSIPESTRTRVREAAARLGYQPNAAARSLRVGPSDVVVGLVPDTGYSATFSDLMLRRFAEIIHGAVDDAGSPLPDRIAVDTARVVARGST